MNRALYKKLGNNKDESAIREVSARRALNAAEREISRLGINLGNKCLCFNLTEKKEWRP